MARAPDARAEQAKELFLSGKKLIEISEALGVSEGTVRSWKHRYKWDNATLQKEKCNVAKKKGAQSGNKNAVGHGAPEQNKNAEKYGFFSKYLPEETREIFSAIDQADPLDLLWHQIQIAYAAIIRAQQIAYVKDQHDMTKEKIFEMSEVTERDTGKTQSCKKVEQSSYMVQFAWDKQNEFLKAQARAQGELRAMIKQYDEMLHKNWDLVTDEQKSRIARIKAQTEKLTGNNQEVEDLDQIEDDIYG